VGRATLSRDRGGDSTEDDVARGRGASQPVFVLPTDFEPSGLSQLRRYTNQKLPVLPPLYNASTMARRSASVFDIDPDMGETMGHILVRPIRSTVAVGLSLLLIAGTAAVAQTIQQAVFGEANQRTPEVSTEELRGLLTDGSVTVLDARPF